MASSGPDILSGFGKVSSDYLRSFPGPPVLQGTGAVLTNTGTASALGINRWNANAKLDFAKLGLNAAAKLTEREMVNEQRKWEVRKDIEYDKSKRLAETIAAIWNTPTTNKAGNTTSLGVQYLGGLVKPPALGDNGVKNKEALKNHVLSTLTNDGLKIDDSQSSVTTE